VRLLELASEVRLLLRDDDRYEKTVFEVTRQRTTILQERSRLALRVEHVLNVVDYFGPMSEEPAQQLDMRRKRRCGGTFVGHIAPPERIQRRWCLNGVRRSNNAR
jgi:hypothetical protein